MPTKATQQSSTQICLRKNFMFTIDFQQIIDLGKHSKRNNKFETVFLHANAIGQFAKNLLRLLW